jgi:hypothetical protein
MIMMVRMMGLLWDAEPMLEIRSSLLGGRSSEFKRDVT